VLLLTVKHWNEYIGTVAVKDTKIFGKKYHVLFGRNMGMRFNYDF